MRLLRAGVVLLLCNGILSCPEVCECELGRVICRDRSLVKFPEGIPAEAFYLDLRDNRITKITKNDLKGLHNLQVLLISQNRLINIEENAFDEVPSLRKFSASRNLLRLLPNLWSGEESLLIHLDVHSNRIRSIDPNLFRKTPHLRTLNLAANNLQSLPENSLEFSTNLRLIHIDENPINCDCRWAKQIDYLLGRENIEAVICFNPPSLREKSIFDVDKSEFRCFPTNRTIFGDHQLLRCSQNEKSIEWIYRGETVENGFTGNYELLTNGSMLIDSSANADDFECAVNYATTPGRKRRQLSRGRRRGPPQFTIRPKNRSYREGSSVRLDCEAVGNPQPKFKWFFNSHELKSSRKHEMNFERTSLIIYPFLERDAGTYECVAHNNYGSIRASASIQLLESSPPVIVDAPESQAAPAGVTVTFRCRATAEPRPFITWFFDGSVIPTLKGHFQVSDDGSELTISQVSRRDEGVYSCMAGNVVGSMMADARLTIASDHHQAVDKVIDEETIEAVVKQASINIDRAIKGTREKLRKTTSPRELLKWIQFSVPQTLELNRAREIYEESIRLLQKHVEQGLSMDLSELPSNVSFESVLAPSHVNALMQLAGCTGTRSKDPCDDHCFHARYRTYDGQCNNEVHKMWGASYMKFRRLLPPIYENGFNTPVGWNPNKLYFGFRKPNPRTVSRTLIQTALFTPHEKYSSMLMQWGQFIDHDMDFTATAISRHAFATGAICNQTCENFAPCFNIQLPPGDPRLIRRPRYPCIEFERSSAVCGSGETSIVYREITYREQMNIITSYIDASGIYGSKEEDAYELRDIHPDRGLLRFDIVSSARKPFLPFERDSSMDCRRNHSLDNPIRCFLAGDYRANEQPGLVSMHTLFMREHNRIAAAIRQHNPNLDGETIFQEARKIVGAELQHITYKHWLPKVLGQLGYDRLIGEYQGYNANLDASISNAFATAAFRFGHTLINPILFRLDKEFRNYEGGHVPLRDAFFAPELILFGGGIDPLLRGLFASPMKKPLPRQLLNTELTEHLFHRAHDVALDLAVMNIQRARDHALPGYTEYRKWCNLSEVNDWDDLRNDMPVDVIGKLRDLYGHPGNVDLFAGGIAEYRREGSLVGPTFSCIIAEQFKRLRDGDRFWYEKEGVFTDAQLSEIKKVTLARILCDNGDHIDRVQDDVFIYPGVNKNFYGECSRLSRIDLTPWRNCCGNLCSVAYNRYRTSNRRRRRRPIRHICEYNGNQYGNGQRWTDNCSRCECTDGEVWCTATEGC